MKFEPLRYEHLRQMAQIEQEAFDQPWSERMFIPEVEDENAYYLVGVRGDEVICYGGFTRCSTRRISPISRCVPTRADEA